MNNDTTIFFLLEEHTGICALFMYLFSCVQS